jgi:hypothetical protein
MFGQQQQSDKNAAEIPEQSIDGVLDDTSSVAVSPSSPTSNWQHPGAPLADTSNNVTSTPSNNDATNLSTTAAEVNSSGSSPANAWVPSSAVVEAEIPADDLVAIKQQALNQLAPLVSHLDQSPEERFRTTMMLIQASDNQDLVKDAYAAAQAITDEKARAQALLDIVNEINYFTQAPAE